MSAAAWLRLFEREGILTPAHAEPAKCCDVLMVDGTKFIDGAIRGATNVDIIARGLCVLIETAAEAQQITSAYVLFDTRLTCPYPHVTTPPLASALRQEVTKHLLALDTDDLANMTTQLHRSQAKTEWPRPLLKDAETRAALWRCPLFEWQLFSHIGTRVQTWPHFRGPLRHVYVTGVPVFAADKPWDEIRREHEKQTGDDFRDELEAFARLGLVAAYQRKRALAVLVNLSLGYRAVGMQQWHATPTEADPIAAALDHVDVRSDVANQVTQICFALALEQTRDVDAQKARIAKAKADAVAKLRAAVLAAEEGVPYASPVSEEAPVEEPPVAPKPPVRVYVTRADPAALWAFLTIVHRLHLSNRAHALELIVSVGGGGGTVHVSALYGALLAHIERRYAFSMDDLLFCLMMQTHVAVGASPDDQAPALLWRTLTLRARYDSLIGVSALYDHTDSLKNSGSMPMHSDTIPPNGVAICSWRELAALNVTIETVRALLKHGFPPPNDAALSLHAPLSPILIHALSTKGDPKPLGMLESLARVRRAHWVFEYTYAASMSTRQWTLRTGIAEEQDMLSQWGVREHVNVDITNIAELLFFDAKIRMRMASHRRAVRFRLFSLQATDGVRM